MKIYFACFLLFSSLLKGNGFIATHETIEGLYNDSNLIILGTCDKVRKLGFFQPENGRFLTSDEGVAQDKLAKEPLATALHCGDLTIEKLFSGSPEIMDSKALSVLWPGLVSVSPNVSIGTGCPAVSADGEGGEKRIWFLRYRHGLWESVTDISPEHEELVVNSIKAIKLQKNAELYSNSDSGQADDPFASKD